MTSHEEQGVRSELGSHGSGRGVKTGPSSRSQRRVSGGVSERSQPTPQKESKTSLAETLRVKVISFLTLETHFDSFWGVGKDLGDCFRDSPGDSVFDSLRWGRLRLLCLAGWIARSEPSASPKKCCKTHHGQQCRLSSDIR